MKKLLLLTLLWMLALPSWADEPTNYTDGTISFKTVSYKPATELKNVNATLEGNRLTIWTSTGATFYDQAFFTEEVPLVFTLDQANNKARLVYTSTSSHPLGFLTARAESVGLDCDLTINKDGVISIVNNSVSIKAKTSKNETQDINNFEVTGLTPASTDPEVKLDQVTYNYGTSFTATLLPQNIEDLSKVTVKAGLSEGAMTTDADVTVSGKSIVAKFNLDLTSVAAGSKFKVYIQAGYETYTFNFTSEEFTKPNGTMTYGLVNYPNGISPGDISYQPGTPGSCEVIGVYTKPTTEGGAGRLTITNFAGIIANPMTFYVHIEAGGRVSLESAVLDGKGNYLYNINPVTASLSGNIVNTSANTSKLTLNPWGPSSSITTFNTVYFDTEIEFAFAIEGLPLNPPSITIRDAAATNMASTSADIKYNLKTENMPEGTTYTLIATVEKYVAPEVGGDDDDDEDYGDWYSVAVKAAGDTDGEEGEEGDGEETAKKTFTFEKLTATEGSVRLTGLKLLTQYTATVQAQAVGSDGKVIVESAEFKMRNFTTTDANPKITLGQATAVPELTSATITVPVAFLDCGDETPDNFTLKYYTGSNSNNATTVTGVTNDGDNYTFTISGLTEGTSYSYNIVGTATVYEKDVTSNTATVSFTTKARTITLGTATATTEATSATVTVPVSYENFDAAPTFTFKYYEGDDATEATNVNATADSNGNYTFTISGLNVNTDYSYNIVAEATVSGTTITSNAAPVSFKTKNPTITLGTATATTDDTSATITVPVTFTNCGDSAPALTLKYYAGNDASEATEANATADSNGNYTFTVSSLAANTDYTFNIVGEATVFGNTVTSNTAKVEFKTQETPAITLGTVTATADNTSATITVPVTFTNCGDAPALTLKYYTGSDSSKAVEATGVTKDGDNYKFTISGLTEGTEYNYSIYAEATVAGSTVTSNTAAVSFTTSGDSGVEVVAVDDDARYFTLQGVEIRNPEAGTLCIKVSGNKATRVIIR